MHRRFVFLSHIMRPTGRGGRVVQSFRTPVLVASVACLLTVLIWVFRVMNNRSVGFAFCVVWAPMAWLGLVSRVWTPTLPAAFHTIRSFEHDGSLYRAVGVRAVKWVLRRGPLSWFNPSLHLPTEPNADKVAALDQRMRDAEASHFVLLVLTLGFAGHAVVGGRWVTAWWIVLFDVLLNGYPVMLQRYNRVLLSNRFPTVRQKSSSLAERRA